jgi:hypothetical protein
MILLMISSAGPWAETLVWISVGTGAGSIYLNTNESFIDFPTLGK